MHRLLLIVCLALSAGCGRSNPDQNADARDKHAINGQDSGLVALSPAPVFIALSDAYPVLEASDQAPPELKGLSGETLERTWPVWIKQRDAQVRSSPTFSFCVVSLCGARPVNLSHYKVDAFLTAILELGKPVGSMPSAQ